VDVEFAKIVTFENRLSLEKRDNGQVPKKALARSFCQRHLNCFISFSSLQRRMNKGLDQFFRALALNKKTLSLQCIHRARFSFFARLIIIQL